MFTMPIDKQLHFLAGAAISGAASPLFPGAGAMAAVIAGWGEEMRQRAVNRRRARQGLLPSHDVDPRDAWMTAAGGLAADAWQWLALPHVQSALASVFTMV